MHLFFPRLLKVNYSFVQDPLEIIEPIIQINFEPDQEFHKNYLTQNYDLFMN